VIALGLKVAFQGAGRHIPKKRVKWLNDFATHGLLPDLTVIVDCPVEVSLARREKREKDGNTRPDRFEKKWLLFIKPCGMNI